MTDTGARLIRSVIYTLWQIPPITFTSEIGAFLVRFISLKYHRTTNATRKALLQINPAYSERELDQTIFKMWQNIGRIWGELMIVHRLAKHHLRINGMEHLITAKKSNRPIIVLFLHTGNWEVLTPFLVANNLVPHVPVEVQRRKLNDDLINRARTANGLVVIPPTLAGTRKIFQCLERGHTLVLAIDEYKNGKVLGPAFGRRLPEANNLEFALRLAKKYNATLLPMHVTRLHRTHFKLHIAPPVTADFLQDSASEARVKNDLKEWSERVIRAHIDQWFMLHRLRFN